MPELKTYIFLVIDGIGLPSFSCRRVQYAGLKLAGRDILAANWYSFKPSLFFEPHSSIGKRMFPRVACQQKLAMRHDARPAYLPWRKLVEKLDEPWIFCKKWIQFREYGNLEWLIFPGVPHCPSRVWNTCIAKEQSLDQKLPDIV